MPLSVPTRLQKAFALSGSKNTIPVASQIGITPGAASYTDGFPPLTRTPIAAGGVPPFGEDMNGVLFDLSAAVQWAQAGGMYRFDSTFSTAIGGYPIGATILLDDNITTVKSTIADNTNNPNSSMTGWVVVDGALSAASSGYKYSGGLLIQWGQITFGGSSGNITFAPAFPTACAFFTATDEGSTAAFQGCSGAVTNTTANGVTFSSTPAVFKYFAVGY
jgi:hypothetical protein